MGIKGRGEKSSDLDRVELALGAQRAKNRKFQAAMDTMTDMIVGAEIGSALPASNFIIKSRGRRKGIIVTMVFYIDKNCTSVKCELLALKDNVGTDPAAIQSAVEECKWEDITDEERGAGQITREFKTALEFNTIYKVTRVVAVNDEGFVRKVKLPATSPYKVAPVVEFVNRYNQSRQDLGTDACFQTATSDDPTLVTDNCAGAEDDVVTPKPRPYVNGNPGYVIAQKVNARGVKPTFKVIVPRRARRLRIVLIRTDEIGTGNGAYNEKIADSWDLDPSDMLPINDGVAAPTNARYVQVRFGKPLDFGVEYQTVLMVVRGDNVGGPGIDEIKNPAMGFQSLDVGTNPATGTFIAGQLADGVNTLLREDTPFVANSLVDYVIKKRGVKAIMHMLVPSVTQELKARITELTDQSADLPDKPTLADDWDDIQTTNDGPSGTPNQLKVRRRFGPTLDFNTTYTLKALVAFGADVGGSGNDKASYKPAANSIRFTTPNADGVFTENGQGNVQFVAITGRRKKKNGVLVKMKINVPTGTESCVVKLRRTDASESGDAAKNTTFEFFDLDLKPRTDGQPGVFFEDEFGIKLDAGDPSTTVTYGVVRIVAKGDNVNPAGQGGPNPDFYRAPATKPALGQYLATFNTVGNLVYFDNTGTIKAQIPAIPATPLATAGDLSNTLDADAPKIVLTVYPTQFRNSAPPANFPAGTGTAGSVTWSDIGATSGAFVTVICNRLGDPSTDNRVSAIAPIDNLSANFLRVEIGNLVFGKTYYIARVIVTSDGDTAKAVCGTSFSFTAGGSIDLNLLTNFFITQPMAIDSRTSQVPVTYVEPTTQAVIARNLILYKDIQGKTGGYVEVSRVVLNDQDFFNPSDPLNPQVTPTKTFTLQATHPAAAQIRFKASLTPVKGGTARPDVLFPTNGTYYNTASEPPVMDAGPPQYSGIRTDGSPNQSPFRTPKMLVRWRASGIKVRFNLPDINMGGYTIARVFFAFTYFIKPASVFIQTVQYYNPNSNVQGSSTAQPTDDTFGVDIGKQAGDFFDTKRPIITGSIPTATYSDVGEIPSGLSTALLFSYNNSQPTFLTVLVRLINGVGSTLLTSGDLNFPFDPQVQGVALTKLVDNVNAVGL